MFWSCLPRAVSSVPDQRALKHAQTCTLLLTLLYIYSCFWEICPFPIIYCKHRYQKCWNSCSYVICPNCTFLYSPNAQLWPTQVIRSYATLTFECLLSQFADMLDYGSSNSQHWKTLRNQRDRYLKVCYLSQLQHLPHCNSNLHELTSNRSITTW